MGNESESESEKEYNEENYIEEVNLKGHPKPITYEEFKIIEEQMKNVCLIECGDGTETNKTGTGFFCKIPFPDVYHLLPVFITNNHVINKMDNNFLISYNHIYTTIIDMNKPQRRYYTERDKYDITIIEIVSDDNIDINSF